MNIKEKMLEVLWTGQASVVGAEEAGEFLSLLGHFLPAPAILIGVPAGAFESRILMDEVEMLPLVSLGDIIADEFGIEVPYGTAIVLCDRAVLTGTASQARRSEVLGRFAAELASISVDQGGIALEQETAAICGLAFQALERARLIADMSGMLDIAAFEAGLVAKLAGPVGGTAAAASLRELVGACLPGNANLAGGWRALLSGLPTGLGFDLSGALQRIGARDVPASATALPTALRDLLNSKN